MVGANYCTVTLWWVDRRGEGATAKRAEVRRAPPIDRIVIVLLCYILRPMRNICV